MPRQGDVATRDYAIYAVIFLFTVVDNFAWSRMGRIRQSLLLMLRLLKVKNFALLHFDDLPDLT